MPLFDSDKKKRERLYEGSLAVAQRLLGEDASYSDLRALPARTLSGFVQALIEVQYSGLSQREKEANRVGMTFFEIHCESIAKTALLNASEWSSPDEYLKAAKESRDMPISLAPKEGGTLPAYTQSRAGGRIWTETN